ncbi:MAG: hypothetical protein ACOYMF_08910 [Bacteroidales bacterium]
MKMKFVILGIILCSNSLVSLAQETRQKFYGIDAGMTLIAAPMSGMDYVRRDVPDYLTGNDANSITSLMYKSSVGIGSEYFSLNSKFGFSGGVRYTRNISSIGKNDYWSNSTSYFYLLYRQEGINTEYLKVKEISQISDYIGIPIEIRYFPFDPQLFRVYFKLGAEISYCVHYKTDVVFYDKAMDPFQKGVSSLAGKPESFSSSAYGAAGFRFGKESKPSVSFEICLPSVFLTSESSGLVNPIFGFGFQLNFQLPY